MPFVEPVDIHVHSVPREGQHSVGRIAGIQRRCRIRDVGIRLAFELPHDLAHKLVPENWNRRICADGCKLGRHGGILQHLLDDCHSAAQTGLLARHSTFPHALPTGHPEIQAGRRNGGNADHGQNDRQHQDREHRDALFPAPDTVNFLRI